MKLAKGTPWWVAASVLLTLAAAAVALLADPRAWYAAAPLALLTALLLNFFRDPERAPGEGVVSAADGIVTFVGDHEGRLRVNVFMNPLDVHVNRAPYDGRVVEVRPVRGGYIPAFRKESERNERVVVEYDTPLGALTTVQIAGTVARRIVPYVAAGARLNKGDRIGMIRLGSRVDHYLPAGCTPTVAVGERVKAGATTIARPPPSEGRSP